MYFFVANQPDPRKRPIRRVLPSLLACALMALSLNGCASSDKYAGGSDFDPASHEFLRPDVDTPFEACVAMCMESGSLALVTRTGCLEGCNELNRRAPLRGKTFRSREACAKAVSDAAMNRDALRQEMRSWCDATWTHIHNRKGCYNATDIYYAAITPEQICGTSYTPPPSVAEPAPATPENAPYTPPAPVTEPAPATPENGTPRIHDTPKYQPETVGRQVRPKPQTPPKSTPATPVKAKPTTGNTLAPRPTPQTLTPTKPAAPSDSPRAVAPQASPRVNPRQTALDTNDSVASPAPVAPSVPARPEAPPRAPAPQTPSNISPAPVGQETYRLPRLTVPSPGPRGSYSTSDSISASQTPDTSVPDKSSTGRLPIVNTQPQNARPSTPPNYTGAPPASSPSVAGSNTSPDWNSPAATPTPTEEGQATPGQGTLIPPVPSMLDQPYRPPTIITP